MNYWLMKSEPDVFSIDDLRKKKAEPWSGVRNYQARNYMREMAVGDLAIFYHSSAGEETGAVGIMKVVKAAYPDPTQFDPKSEYHDAKATKENPRWDLVDVAFVEKFPQTLLLQRLREEKKLAGMVLLQRGTRLSVTPVAPAHFELVLHLGRAQG